MVRRIHYINGNNQRTWKSHWQVDEEQGNKL